VLVLKIEHGENQAEKLQQLFAEVTNQPASNHENETEKDVDFIEVDVLNLPPRSEVHGKPKRKYYIRLKSPIMRFMTILLFLLVVISVIYFLAGEQIFLFFS